MKGVLLVFLASVFMVSAGELRQPPKKTGKKTAPPQGAQFKGTCVTSECHQKEVSQPVVHGPLVQNACQRCHKFKDVAEHTFTLVDGGKPSMCLQCHEMPLPPGAVPAAGKEKAGKEKGKDRGGKTPPSPPHGSVHKPFSETCLSCHDPHGGKTRNLLKFKSANASCEQCHPGVGTKGKKVHGPVAVKACVVCHSPHFSKQPDLLLKKPTELCLSCHEDKKEEMAKAVSVHQAVKDGCTGCHSAHESNDPALLKGPGIADCMACHKDFLSRMEKKKYFHGALTENHRCANCHSPHFSKERFLLKEKPSLLCMDCHTKEITVPAKGKNGRTRTIPSILEQIKGKKFLHGPVKVGNCAACHNGHGSDYINLLRFPFPGTFYAEWNKKAYLACFECHESRLVSEKRTTKSTGFRNGDLNLHYLHTMRKKGRTCRACHAEHASSQPKLIREKVPFGSWAFDNVFKKTPTGGTCATGCHRPKAYDRKNPVKY